MKNPDKQYYIDKWFYEAHALLFHVEPDDNDNNGIPLDISIIIDYIWKNKEILKYYTICDIAKKLDLPCNL